MRATRAEAQVQDLQAKLSSANQASPAASSDHSRLAALEAENSRLKLQLREAEDRAKTAPGKFL